MSDHTILYEVTAFSDDKNAGSPTGVVFDTVNLSERQMQEIARKLDVSHTAFVSELGQATVGIRFFTSECEINNCGHATIAAHWLRSTLKIDDSTHVKQHTQKGIQDVEFRHEHGRVSVHFKQNTITFTSIDEETVLELLVALNIGRDDLNPNYPIMLVSPGVNRFLVCVNSLSTLKSVRTNIEKLKELCERNESIGCFVYTIDSANTPFEAHGRMFAPVIGIDEDIINGNSSGCLGAYLLQRETAMNELNLQVHQGFMLDRPGTVLVTASRHNGKIETYIGGTATLVSERTIDLSI